MFGWFGYQGATGLIKWVGKRSISCSIFWRRLCKIGFNLPLNLCKILQWNHLGIDISFSRVWKLQIQFFESYNTAHVFIFEMPEVDSMRASSARSTGLWWGEGMRATDDVDQCCHDPDIPPLQNGHSECSIDVEVHLSPFIFLRHFWYYFVKRHHFLFLLLF